ncbi:TPA: hypothetical protein ACVS13_003356 [Enterobacter hormaechei]
MQWISTASQKIDERLYRVCVWVKKYHADAINRVVLRKVRISGEILLG